MGTPTLLSVDLDWFNTSKNPVKKLQNLLKQIPPNIPAVCHIQHHHFLPDLREWVKDGLLPKPFDIVNIDEHHDYYNGTGRDVNCGNWGYHIPQSWYQKYIWVGNNVSEDLDWNLAEEWFDKHNITFSRRRTPRLNSITNDIKAAAFCVSPDYLGINMLDTISRMVDVIRQYFDLQKVPEPTTQQSLYYLRNWRMTTVVGLKLMVS